MSYVDVILDIIDELDRNKLIILKNTKQLILELKLNNIHQYFYLYCYLLWNGYFSYTKSHEYSDIGIGVYLDTRVEEENSIYMGKGVCRHYTKFLVNLLKTFNIKSKDMELRLENSTINSIMNIDRKVGECTDFKNNDDGTENHKVVLVKDNEYYYILDPTNLCEQVILKNKKIYSFSGNYNVNKTLFERYINTICGESIKYPEKSLITKEILERIYKETERKCIINKSLLEEFYNNNKPYYEKQKRLINDFIIN